MKVSLNLLKEYADFDEPVDEILEVIATKIGEVEDMESLGELYKGIVVGRIVDTRPHPDADKLSVNKVDIGKKANVQVIAGDKTLKKGDFVAYIPPGNVVPVTSGKQELKLDIRKIRGLDSHGMLASEYELKFSSAHEGVLKLDPGLSPGRQLSDIYGLDDHIIDVETKVLTHRPDMFGHLGFARELAAAKGKKFTSPDWYLDHKIDWPKPAHKLDISLDNQLKDLVPRFTLAAYEGVIVGSSPLQVKSWLMRLGLRPVNNIVDLTNYLMVVSGQPMHAFDYDKVANGKSGAKFTVRHPKAGEQLKLIDGSTVKPHKQSIIIAGTSGPIGLGGVMGGADSEVDERTKRVVLEAANFDMYSIRNTSMAHGIASEAVTRFARGQDPSQIAPIQNLAKNMIVEWAGAKPASRFIDEYPKPRKFKTVSASPSAINRLLGTNHTPSSMAKCLENAEIKVKSKGSRLDVTVPTWRPDLNIEADIAEEVGRLNGYGGIESTRPQRSIVPADLPKLRKLELAARDALRAAGASEVLSYSGVREKLLESAGQDIEQAYRIRNALSPNVEMMRLSLTPSLIDKVYPNIRLGYSRFVMFEIGPVHSTRLIEDKLPKEQPSLAVVYAADSKADSASGTAYFTAQAYLSHLFAWLGVGYELSPTMSSDDPWLAQAGAPYEPTRRAYVKSEGKTLGVLGELSYQIASQLKLPRQTAGFELQLERLLNAAKFASRYRPLSKFPPVVVDLTLKSPKDLPYSQLVAGIEACSFKEVGFSTLPLEIFAPNRTDKHTSFRLEFVSHERTLTQKEVNSWLDKIIAAVNKKTGAVQA